jgi:hypothetical protein
VGKLYEAGIDFEYILAAANRRGKVGWSYVGDKGPGLYFFKAGGGMVKLEPPKDPSCGWLCSVGFGITQVFDCRSVKGCLVQDVLFFTPTPAGKGTRLMKAKPWLMKVLKLERRGKRVARIAKVAKEAEVAAGGLRIVGEGFSASEKRAAQALADQGHTVVLRAPTGVGRTSDLLVDTVPYDVYTPITADISRIVSETAKKGSQVNGGGVVIDLSRSSLTPRQLGNILPRVRGVTSKISNIIVLP